METWLRVLVPLHFAVFSFVCFFWRILAFQRKNQMNPLILPSSDSLMGYVTVLLKLVAIMTTFSVIFFIFSQDSDLAGGIYQSLNSISFKVAGLVLFFVSLILTATSQIQMGNSWRVGIDTKVKTDLVRRGLYRYSRNPIYLGIMITLVGFFLILPHRFNLVIVLFAFSVFGVLIRIEEEHMRSLHGAQFDEYCKSVRRWI